MTETWKDIINSNCQVSNLGRVRSKSSRYGLLRQYSKWCSPTYSYLFVEIWNKGKKKIHKVHRLVACAFLENPDNYPIVMHLDNDPHNNAVDNLKWGTYKMNSEQMMRDNRHARVKGESHSESKLTEQQVLEIRSKYVPRKYTLTRLAEEYKVSFALIHLIIKRIAWKHI